MAARRSRRAKAMYGALLCALFLALVESAARLVGVGAAPASGAAGFASFDRMLVELGGFAEAGALFESDPELLWRPRPGARGIAARPPLWLDNRVNALGYRDPERDFAAPRGALRLLCLGDSCTWGVGVRGADAWPQALEALLEPAFHDRVVEVWNGGVPGWSSDQGRVRLARDGARIAPAIVTICFGINDAFHRDLARHKERGHGGCRTDREVRARLAAPLARCDRVLSRLALYRGMKRLLPASEPAADKDAPGGQRVPLPEYEENVRAMVAQARQLGARAVLIVWPQRWQLEARADRALDPPTPYQLATRALGGELEVPVLDLLERLADAPGIWVDSVHLNAEGCRRVASALGEFLLAQSLLPEPPPAPVSPRER